MTPRDIAKDYLHPYVVRGDSYDSIASAWRGCGCRDYQLQVGGTIWQEKPDGRMRPRDIDRSQLVVYELDGKACWIGFSVDELIAEIQQAVTQPSLWEMLGV